MMTQVASHTEIGKNMLETVTLQRTPPVTARRHPSGALSHGQDP